MRSPNGRSSGDGAGFKPGLTGRLGRKRFSTAVKALHRALDTHHARCYAPG